MPYDTDAPSLADIARECAAETSDYAQAAELLVVRARAIPGMWEALVAPFEKRAAIQYISSVSRDQRRHVWSRPGAPDARVAALGQANAGARLMDFRLPGGQPIATADAESLRAAATFYLTQAADMAWKGRWLAVIADAIPDDATVADALTEDDLLRLREDTK